MKVLNLSGEYISMIEEIGIGLENSNLEQTILDSFERETKGVMQHLNTTAIETFVFCTVFSLTNSNNSFVTVNKLCKYYFKLQFKANSEMENKWKPILSRTLDFLTLQAFLKYDEKHNGYTAYLKENDFLPHLLQRFFFESTFYKTISNQTCKEFIKDLKKAYKESRTFSELQSSVEKLELKLSPNKEKDISLLDIEDRILLYVFCLGMATYDLESLEKVLKQVYPDDRQLRKLRTWDFECSTSHLQTCTLVELRDDLLEDEDGRCVCSAVVTMKGLKFVFRNFAKNIYWMFYEYVHSDFFDEGLDPFYNGNDFSSESSPYTPPLLEKLSTIIEPSEIKEVNLIFSSGQDNEMKKIIACLNEKNYRRKKDYLLGLNENPCLTVLFYGSSGTGKTESVLQIARMTKHLLFKIELGQLRTSHVGDNEQRVQRIFEEYKQFCNKCSDNGLNTPILFLNELDGFFSKRNITEGTNASIQQSENTMLNIFFNSLDVFDGILFATTNHPEYLDNALQHRFFFKMKFDKPSSDIRAKIWQNTLGMKHIPQEEIKRLAADYDFSGAELKNIMKKSIFLWNGKPTIEELQHCCEEEQLGDDAELIQIEKAFEIITPSNIEEKNLYFDSVTDERLSEIAGCLDKDNFLEMQKRMTEKRIRNRFSVLLYGDSGTGKTETVLQLAKKTNRKIAKIDTSQIKSKYIGEGERNLKNIFMYYKKECKRCKDGGDQIPILLLNEADGLLTKRVEISDYTASQAHWNNSLMSIFLDEMDRFEGILFATTNLAGNLDEALERRFLYKINFCKPNAEVSAQIWKSKLSVLSEEEIEILVGKYDLSGGEIDNIVRKSDNFYIVKAMQATFSDIKRFCEEERRSKNEIGFTI